MSRSPVVRLATALAALAVASVSAATPADADDPVPGRIVGHFTTYGTGAPVSNAYVSVVDSSDSYAGYAITDDAGAFELSDLAPGDYKVSFSSDTAYQWFHQKTDSAAADPVTVVTGADTQIEEQTLPTGSLEVAVVDAVTGQPVADACVDASGPSFRNGCSPTGVVTFTDLLVGVYRLSATGDVLHLSDSGEAAVTADATARVTVPLDPAAAILLRARDAATGAPLPGVCARAVATASPGLGAESGGDCTDAEGRVTIGRLRAGDYRLLAAPGDQLHGLQWVGAAGGTGIQEKAATVHARVSRVTPAPTAQIDRSGMIAGTVTDAATGAPVEGVCASPYAFSPMAGPDNGRQCTGSDGRFVLGGLGPYAWPVEYVDFSGKYAWQWSGGAVHRLAASAVRVRVGRSATADARLVAGARIAGRVSGPDGQPRWAAAEAFNTVSGDFAAAYGPTDETGTYEIAGLAAQEVKVRAVPSTGLDGGSIWYRDAAGFATATPLAVPAGGSLTGVDLTLPQ